MSFKINKTPFTRVSHENLSPDTSKNHSKEVQDLALLIQKVKSSPLSPRSPNTPEKREREYELPASGQSAKKGLFKTPLPSPAIKNFGISQEVDLTPPTPMSKGKVLRRSPSLNAPSESPFKRMYQELEKGRFILQGKVVPVEKLGEGSFFSVYGVKDELDLMPRVIKAFHGKKTDFFERTLKAYLEQSLANYKLLVELKLPVASIYNVETALRDHTIIQEKVPYAIDPLNQEHMNQAQAFFSASVCKDILMDLQPENLRVKQDGCVVLIDFVEEEDNPVQVYIKKACKAWIETCPTQFEADNRLRFLTAGFLNQHEEYNDAWLKEVIGEESKTP